MFEKSTDLFLTDLKYHNFRNYPSLELSFSKPLTIFIGKNAVGKTNILEGIQLLTTQTSFRNPLTSELIFFGEDSASLQTHLTSNTRELDLKCTINEGKRKYFINEKSKRIQELKGLLPAVIFTPDDLNLIKGSNSIKRDTLDNVGIQISSNYYVIKKDYEKILHHKNQLLKEPTSLPFLESIDETLIKIGTQLFCYRYSLYKKLNKIFTELYPQITHETAYMSYFPSWGEEVEPEKEKIAEIFKTCLENKRTEEIQRKRALIGPHADSITFCINNKNARIYGSQGQQRSLVLCFKLAEVKFIQEVLGQRPILLLDDVMSELDDQRRKSLLHFISHNIQTFITATTLNYFSQEITEQAEIIYLPPQGGAQ